MTVDTNAIAFPPELKSHEARDFIREVAALCQPSEIDFCDGSEQEYQQLCNRLVEAGTFVRLNAEHQLNPGDILLMGQQLFRVDI